MKQNQDEDFQANSLEAVLNESLGSSVQYRLERMNDLARRSGKHQPASSKKAGVSPRVALRQSVRERWVLEQQNQNSSRYSLAYSTFERLQKKLNAEFENQEFIKGFQNWKIFFDSTKNMDLGTFNRFTLWHSRVQKDDSTRFQDHSQKSATKEVKKNYTSFRHSVLLKDASVGSSLLRVGIGILIAKPKNITKSWFFGIFNWIFGVKLG